MKTRNIILESRPQRGGAAPVSLEDISRFGNDGTFHSDATLTPLQLSSGLWYYPFDAASNEYIDCGSGGLPATLDAFAASFWVKSPLGGSARLLSYRNGAGGNLGFSISNVNANQFCASFSWDGDATRFGQLITITDETAWKLIVITKDAGDNILMYENGISQSSTPVTIYNIGAVDGFNIGRRTDGSNYQTCSLALLRIFFLALSAATILRIYIKERPLFGV